MPTFHTTFISHAHADNDIVADYAARLLARGINLWLDLNDAQKGHDLSGDITAQLEGRSALVLMVTAAANDSRWVAMEVSNFINLYADKQLYRVNGVERLILPVRLEAVPIPGRLRSFNWIDAVGRSRDQVVDEIAHALQLTAQPGTIIQPPPPLPPQRTSYPILARLDSLGFEGFRNPQGVAYIVPPMCAVPAGKFTMGSAQDDPEKVAYYEKPQYRIEVGEFEIGTYPVTVAEYALAVTARAVPVPNENAYPMGATTSQAWRGRNLTWEIQQKRADHPVVCVTWDNARDYCLWLANMTGQPWRLPTEAEWEKAARWDDAKNHARKYPWGDQWDKARANTSDGGPGLTTPIGAYISKGDASPYGVHEMTGNVVELTSTLWYEHPPYDTYQHEKDADITSRRVGRGGSWLGDSSSSRSAFRGSVDRTFWSVSVGFRVARTGRLAR